MGLDPRSTGSGTEPKADAQPLSHPGIPPSRFSVGDIWRYYLALGRRPGQGKLGDEKMAQAMCVSLLDQALVRNPSRRHPQAPTHPGQPGVLGWRG